MKELARDMNRTIRWPMYRTYYVGKTEVRSTLVPTHVVPSNLPPVAVVIDDVSISSIPNPNPAHNVFGATEGIGTHRSMRTSRARVVEEVAVLITTRLRKAGVKI